MQIISLIRSLGVRFFVAVFALLILVACGPSSSTTANQVTPISALPTTITTTKSPSRVTPTSEVIMPGQVNIMVDRSHYAVNETITVTVSNGLTTAIFVSPYRTNCTPVTLEVKHPTGWIYQNPCLKVQSASPTQLQPGSVTTYRLTPSVHVPGTTPRSLWQSGDYRVSISYLTVPDPDSVQGGIIVHSQNFSLG